ncbi:hypothetical protein [Bordetella genomosp. 5]|uniref:Uncharacterized protein n=1 Tax=Bordetella genomosp. 5 TaxID=1395608 RepID=A0A261TAH6_9BORD|nr:hypothetical protein [Bordetella genomosp. 5]OZI46634.1 hypothetical protein CAL25_18220 [Bordetella genomosp. 5]
MSSSVSATDKVRAQQSSLAKREETGREPDRTQPSDSLQTPRQTASSFSVALSEDALERMLAAREALSRFAIESAQSRKDYARTQVERIKERIETLKKLLMMLGDSAARAILREIKQLAGELGAAASVLREGGGGGGGVTVPPVQAAGETATATADTGAGLGAQTAPGQGANAGHEGGSDHPSNAAAPTSGATAAAAMYAAVASTPVEPGAGAPAAGSPATGTPAAGSPAAGTPAADSDETDAADPAPGTAAQVNAQAQSAQARQAEAAQRREDAKALEEALRALKALLAMAQAKIREGDEAARRDAETASREIGEIAQDVTALSLSGLPGGAGVDIPAAPGIPS